MPTAYQIIPSGSMYRPKIETHINDNTEVVANYAYGGGTNAALLCVFASPKGRDNQIITIKDGIGGFMKEFGLGPFSLYGQPLLNAYSAASSAGTSNAMLHCLRVTAEDAEYSVATLVAKYHVDTTDHKMSIKFVVKPATTPLTDIDNLADCCTVSGDADDDGYNSVKLFSVAYQGRGEYGKNIRFRITTDRTTDKENSYKNYNFAVYRNENLLEQVENFNVTFVEDSVVSGASRYAEDIINDSYTGSSIIKMAAFPEGFGALYAAYLTAQPDTTFTLNDFDALLGIDKYTRLAIDGLTIEPASAVTPAEGETAVDLSSATGIALLGGSDGSLAANATGRNEALNALYLSAFSGEIDENIKSKNRYPTTLILDANYPIATKLAIATLAVQRGDCMAMLDFGTGCTSKASIGTYYDTNFDGVVDTRLVTFEPYAMKVRDPYSQKTVTVTSTYWLASETLQHFANWNGKHRPLAGNRFGIISGMIANSVYPVFDEDLDVSMMDEFAEKHLNYARFNQNQVVVRSMQNTAQGRMTALSEQSNVLILLDIKRDCEKLCAQFEYDFSEITDIARFNAAIGTVAEKYADAQVRSISAHFDKNAWEAERGIIHLYVEMVHRDLVKTTIIEIDVNRSES